MTTARLADDKVIDEYGHEWEIFADDGSNPRHLAIHRDAGEKYVAAEFTVDHEEIYPANEGDTFGVNCQEEYVVKGGQWVENEAE